MPDPMRIRATEQPDGVDVRVLMSHEMETGQRRDSAGTVVPAHFIQTVVVNYNGKPVLNAEWGPAVVEEPVPAVQVQGRQEGRKGQRHLGRQQGRDPHRRSDDRLMARPGPRSEVSAEEPVARNPNPGDPAR